MTDPMCLVRLPDATRAPGYREALALRSHFAVQDFGDGVVGVSPAEGPGATAEHFGLTRLCDAHTDLSNASTWNPLMDYPPRRRTDVDELDE